MDLQSALNNLHNLKHKGIITAAEYNEQKKRILVNANNSTIQPTTIISCNKSRNIYILLAFLLGCFGVHNFYAGRIKRAIGQIVLLCLAFTILSAFILGIWIFIDMCTVKTDEKNHLMTPINKWGITLIVLEVLRWIIGIGCFWLLLYNWPAVVR